MPLQRGLNSIINLKVTSFGVIDNVANKKVRTSMGEPFQKLIFKQNFAEKKLLLFILPIIFFLEKYAKEDFSYMTA